MVKMQISSILVFFTLISISNGKDIILQPSLEKQKESDYGLPLSTLQVSISSTSYEKIFLTKVFWAILMQKNDQFKKVARKMLVKLTSGQHMVSLQISFMSSQAASKMS